MNYHFEDFTESEYRKLVRLAVAKWEMIPYTEYRKEGKVCLWRHDIDLSPHRARRLAEIEAEAGLRATYYVLPHSQFYSFLEREVRDLIRGIVSLGHHIGLHFDPNYYDAEELRESGIVEKLAAEKALMESLLGVNVATFSYHNSDLIPDSFKLDREEVAGMVNASCAYLKQSYYYCSDSNGYWRFSRLPDVLETTEPPRLHVLTHPEWWVPEPMSPRDRVTRCIEGRAKRLHDWYDGVLAQLDRTNVR